MSEDTFQERQTEKNDKKYKSVTATLSLDDLAILNQRLRVYGFETAGELIHAFVEARFPPRENLAIAKEMGANQQANGGVTAYTKTLPPHFWKTVDREKMQRFYLKNCSYSWSYSMSLINYFEKHSDTFFGSNPESIFNYSAHKRAWILNAMRNFGEFWLFLYNDDEAKTQVHRIIERYKLNKGLDMKRKIYIVEDNFVNSIIQSLKPIQGEMGFWIRYGLMTGMREDELRYLYMTPECRTGKPECTCENTLHVHHKANGVTAVVLNWFRKNKRVYFTLMPTQMYHLVKSLPRFTSEEIHVTHEYTRRMANIKFTELRKIHYNVLVKGGFEMSEADIVAGRAKTAGINHYLLHDLGDAAEKYKVAWEKFDMSVDVINAICRGILQNGGFPQLG